jgi:thiamine biosynthesis lipoprotein
MNQPEPTADLHRFTHDAMNTTFSLWFRGLDEYVAQGMARECCDLLDLLENKLSRFVEGSDVSRINHLQPGETLYLSESCHQCLLLAVNAHADTGGLFDVTLGTSIHHRKNHGLGPVPPLAGSLTIHPDRPAVTCLAAGREIDLGGIGKGFALDQLKHLLREWGAQDVMLTAGASSLLAFGPHTWPVDLAGEHATARVFLTNQSLSASGTGIQGSHIVHPWGADAMPAHPCRRLWVTAKTAVLAEIWSTTLMLIDPPEIPDFLAGQLDVSSVYIDRDGRVERL